MSLSSVSELVCHMLDPRGRCNRKGLLLVAGLLMTIEIVVGAGLWLAGVDLGGSVVVALKMVCIWFAICAGSKRLHDLDLRAWWMLGTLAAVSVWTIILGVTLFVLVGENALEPGTGWYMLALIGSATPIFAAALWLHFRQGAQGVNRFGTEPQGLGFSGPRLNFQPAFDLVQRLQRIMAPQTA